MERVSRQNPFFFLTSVAKDRLPIFRTEQISAICASAFDEARKSAGLKIFAYVIMPDHYHIITNSARTSAEALRFLNGIAAKRVIDHLKVNGNHSSLLKLREETKKRNYRHSLWEHHPNIFEIYGEDNFLQKVNYIHDNPVRAGLAAKPEDYRYSSARIWNGLAVGDEPLLVDIGDIDWWK